MKMWFCLIPTFLQALKNAQNLVERHQATATNLQTQLETTESHKTAIVDENNKLKEIIKSLHEVSVHDFLQNDHQHSLWCCFRQS